ncbi:MAG TPA: DUF885 family protein [Rhizomicrobium sp.]|nr:DUF885 family protein [Rhizomicrobium sp.]
MLIDRRTLLLSGAATTALAFVSTPFARAATPASGPLYKMFDAFMDEALTRSPEGTTGLGLDTGKRAYEKSKLDDRSLASIASDKARNADQMKRLKTIDRKSLTGMDAVNYDVVMYGLVTQDDANRAFDYGTGGAGSPYVISQLTGAYQQIPDFLDSQHAIETKEDADAYLSRLEAFATAMDQEAEVSRHDKGLGVSPPDFALDKALTQLTRLRGTDAAKSVLVQSVVRRTAEKKIAGDYGAKATKILTDKAYPSLDRQIALAKDLRAHATHDAGVWKLPKGEEYYADSVINWTTTNMKPEEIHKTGLDLVAQLSARTDALMKAQGLTKGTVGERFRAMFSDPKFRYPNTDAGKENLIADLNKKVEAVQAKLLQFFGTLPKAKLEIRRVPKYTEAGAPSGYYQQGSLDGKRPGAYYINLRDTAEVPSWTLPTLTYHEGIPGHHLQLSLQQEADLPLIRKVSFFSAYIEGWALYAEQLADEMGMYEHDPFGKIGYLHDAMLRSVRLVIDSGVHAMKWTREQSIKYYVDNLGDQDATATTEVERYCVWPGQACGYMLGKLTWLKLREKAKTELGTKYDIHQFHDAGLLSAAMPLTVLESVIGNYIAAKKA